MKFKWKYNPPNGTERTVKKFLLFPTSIDSEDGFETRWLEIVTMRQVLTGRFWEPPYWKNVEFVKTDVEICQP